MKILICQLRNHGDIIRTFPLIEALKKKYPDIFIGFTCFKEMVETSKLCQDIDEIIIQTRLMPVEDSVDNTRICDCEPLEELVYQVRKKGYDLYIDLHGVFQSSVFGSLTEIPLRLGRSMHTTKDGAHLFYNIVANVEKREMNRMERHFNIAREYFNNLLPVTKSDKVVKKDEVAVIPGSSHKGILKRWGINKYIELIDRISDTSKVNVLLGPEELDLYKDIQKHRLNNTEIIKVNLWEEYLNIFEKCFYVVGNDTAALHIAIWKQIPAIMICGPTSAVINSVWKYGPGLGVIGSVDCNCKDVWSGKCTKNHKCMESISVDMVLEKIKNI